MGWLKKKLTFMVSPIFTSAVCIPVKTRFHHYSKTVMVRGHYGPMTCGRYDRIPTCSSPMWMKLVLLFICGYALILAVACLSLNIFGASVLAFNSTHKHGSVYGSPEYLFLTVMSKWTSINRLTVITNGWLFCCVSIVTLTIPLAAVRLFFWPGSNTTSIPCAGVLSGFRTSAWDSKRMMY